MILESYDNHSSKYHAIEFHPSLVRIHSGANSTMAKQVTACPDCGAGTFDNFKCDRCGLSIDDLKSASEFVDHKWEFVTDENDSKINCDDYGQSRSLE